MTENPQAPNSPNLSSASIPKINPHFRLQWEQAQEAFVLLYPEGMIKLNFSGGEILKRCDGNTNVSAIIEDLKQSFPEAPGIEADVMEFLALAQSKQWLAMGGA